MQNVSTKFHLRFSEKYAFNASIFRKLLFKNLLKSVSLCRKYRYNFIYALYYGAHCFSFHNKLVSFIQHYLQIFSVEL
jgi:hypothetical protein